MIRYRFYVGTRDGQDVNKAVSHWDVQEYLVREFGGYTATQARGAWADGGKVQVEDSVVYEVLVDEGANVTRATDHANTVRVLASQKCVLWTCERVQGGFAS